MAYIPRAMEELLKRKYASYKCVAITGARQVGKSTLIKHTFPKVKRINLKSPTLLETAQSDPDSFLGGFGTPLFVDEVQECPALLNSAKVILDEKEDNGNYLFSGSQKWAVMEGLSDSLSGMVGILELPGLSLREIYNVPFTAPFLPSEEYIKQREKALVPYEDIWSVIHRGSYPELTQNPEKDWEEFYGDYVKTYIERDVYRITRVRDYMTFYRFLVAVAARTGNMLDYVSIASEVGVSNDTVKSWVGVLVKTDIAFLLYPYASSHLSRAIRTPKIYFRDTGLAAYLTSWLSKEALERGAVSGAFFETFVVNEIAKSYANAGKDFSKYLFYYRGKDKVKRKQGGEEVSLEREIDLVIEQNGVLYPIEIKKRGNPTAMDAEAFPVLDKAVDKKRGVGVILCTGKEKIQLRDNLYSLPIEYI